MIWQSQKITLPRTKKRLLGIRHLEDLLRDLFCNRTSTFTSLNFQDQLSWSYSTHIPTRQWWGEIKYQREGQAGVHSLDYDRIIDPKCEAGLKNEFKHIKERTKGYKGKWTKRSSNCWHLPIFEYSCHCGAQQLVGKRTKQYVGLRALFINNTHYRQIYSNQIWTKPHEDWQHENKHFNCVPRSVLIAELVCFFYLHWR